MFISPHNILSHGHISPGWFYAHIYKPLLAVLLEQFQRGLNFHFVFLKESSGLEKKTTVSKALAESSNFWENRTEL